MPWPKGKPRRRIEDRPVAQTVRLSPQTADVIIQIANAHRLSVYAYLSGVVERVFEKQVIRLGQQTCYRAPEQPSTLGSVLRGNSRGRVDKRD